MVAASFIFFLLLFALIGGLSTFYARRRVQDYLVASRQVPAWLAALSAVASNNSGFMFVGQIGATYEWGLASIWMMVGWLSGDYMAWRIVHPRLRAKAGQRDSNTFANILGNWHGEEQRLVVLAGALLTILFLGSYAAAQLNAGSKALHVLFGWEYGTGAIIGAAIILLYCYAGGIRASIWTDAAQSFVMLAAIILMLGVSYTQVGGPADLYTALKQADPALVSVVPPDISSLGLMVGVGWVLGWAFAGMGAVGQPHIMIRIMAIDSVESIRTARRYYFAWYTVFFVLVIATGLCARVLLPEVGKFDEELALPMMARSLLPDVLVGMVLAGLFAATMSTADSQILSCSAALTQDIPGEGTRSYLTIKLATVAVTALALGIALTTSEDVFGLVLVSWSVLAVAFGPPFMIYALGGRMAEWVTLTVMAGGLAVTFAWRWLGWHDYVYELLPGMLAGFAIYFATLLAPRRAES